MWYKTIGQCVAFCSDRDFGGEQIMPYAARTFKDFSHPAKGNVVTRRGKAARRREKRNARRSSRTKQQAYNTERALLIKEAVYIDESARVSG
jgi:hypothetical protein